MTNFNYNDKNINNTRFCCIFIFAKTTWQIQRVSSFPFKNMSCKVIIMPFLFFVMFIFILKVSGKQTLIYIVCFPSNMMDKINKNSQIIESIFVMRFTEATIIGQLRVRVFLARTVINLKQQENKQQACSSALKPPCSLSSHEYTVLTITQMHRSSNIIWLFNQCMEDTPVIK